MDDFSISPLLWWIGLSLQGCACSIYKPGLDHAVDCLWMPGQVCSSDRIFFLMGISALEADPGHSGRGESSE